MSAAIKLYFIELINKVFDEAYEEVKRIREITNLQEQSEEAQKAMDKARIKWNNEVYHFWVQHKEKLGVPWYNIDQEFTGLHLKSYEGQYSPYKILAKIWWEASEKAKQLGKIQNSICDKCKKKLSEDNCYVYIYENRNIKKWAIEQAKEFDVDRFHILFCSENCFKQSYHYPQKYKSRRKKSKPKKSSKKTNQQLENQEIEQEEYTYCRECVSKVREGEEYWYHTSKNDNNKFCSEKCFINYYGEYCLTHKPPKKFLTIYRLEEKDHFGYCWDCYQEKIRKLKVLEKEKKELEERIEKKKRKQEVLENNNVNNPNREREMETKKCLLQKMIIHHG
ncbi:hypothetical protein [endosymbiont GvMRE of Glomus versiforme]|uniref:hypothetical protein n=1 Tax=endosymbiont GvMRE of Glomus versiforme TaxID=2039283 RepID=UPI000EF037DB|nr:hypothetical protein [endosymbiont GvMRE of Glomus versiforme]RHZ36125.1 hypothetical protein GvMRE_Ic2g10 [endosymbiont GvMRE of Glomus versiforme]